MVGREEMKEKEREEERGRDGVFNLLSGGEKEGGEEVQARRTREKGDFGKGGEG